MKSKHYIHFFSLLAVLLVYSCKNKPEAEQPTETEVADGQVNLRMDTQWGNDEFVIEQVYTDTYGNRIRVDQFLSYISQIFLVKDDGTEILLKDFYLANFENDLSLDFTVPAGHYSGLKLGLGIPASYNKHEDPAQYPSSHPLSVAGSQGMFWYWNTGYIFTKFEGKIDTTGTPDAELLDSFLFHIGDDPYYRELQFTALDLQVPANGQSQIALTIQVDQILAPVAGSSLDLATNAVTHTSEQDVLATTFFDNYAASIVVE
jgi:hypothetical protein